MSNQPISDQVGGLATAIKKYLLAHFKLVKAESMEKLIHVGTYFLTVVSIIIIFSLMLFSLTFAFSFWYSSKTGDLVGGFLIASAFDILVGLAVFIFRRNLFSNNMVRNLAHVFLSDKSEEEDE